MTTLRFWLLAAALYAPLASANDTTPFQCERLTIAKTRSWVAPIVRDFCEKQEASNGQTMAKLTLVARRDTGNSILGYLIFSGFQKQGHPSDIQKLYKFVRDVPAMSGVH